MVAGTAAAATVDLRWGGKGWDVGIYAIALEESMAAQMPKLTTGAAESVEHSWLSRRAHLRLVLLRTPVGTVAVVATAVLRRGPRDITAGAAAATAV